MPTNNTQKITQNTTPPMHIMLDKWQDIGFFWQGSISVDMLTRLLDKSLPKAQQQHQKMFDLALSLDKKNGVLRLCYRHNLSLMMPCDRCLEPISMTLPECICVYLLHDEAQMHHLSDDDAFLFLHDLPNDGQNLPIMHLFEDELLLCLPTAVYHDDCAPLIDRVEDVAEQSPFAVLASLKTT